MSQNRVKVLSFMVLFTLTLQTCLSKEDTPKPTKPCTEMGNNNGYEIFLDHHLRKGSPDSNNTSMWQKFITKIKTWDRMKQSFFPYRYFNSVIGVCSSGGKNYMGNLCISKKSFLFYTVELDEKKKKVRSVKTEKKHVILGCNKIANKCLPVHFEGNKNDSKPNNNNSNCGEAKFMSNTSFIHMGEAFPWL